MEVVLRCRNLMSLRNSVTYTLTQFDLFHSTPVYNEKWKKKWNSDIKRSQQPSKNFIRYATRQKRADAKRALKGLLFNGGAFRSNFQDGGRRTKKEDTSSWDAHLDDDYDNSSRKFRSRSSQHPQKAERSRMKRKFQRDFVSEDDDHPETMFHAAFGNRWYTWAFNRHGFSFQSSTNGFEWREDSTHRNGKYKGSNSSESESEPDNEAFYVGCCSDRKVLGLPQNGPLTIDAVKDAFRLSAMKWHPDKHQGPSQAAAEERFKLCVNAYKSLCGALSAAA